MLVLAVGCWMLDVGAGIMRYILAHYWHTIGKAHNAKLSEYSYLED
jgi:hypothetical protein